MIKPTNKKKLSTELETVHCRYRSPNNCHPTKESRPRIHTQSHTQTTTNWALSRETENSLLFSLGLCARWSTGFEIKLMVKA